MICNDCEGDGETYVGSSVPDDEGYDPCLLCGGSGSQPTDAEIADLRGRYLELQGDNQALKAEIEQWQGRCADLEKDRGT